MAMLIGLFFQPKVAIRLVSEDLILIKLSFTYKVAIWLVYEDFILITILYFLYF